jgi:hypothetical protein
MTSAPKPSTGCRKAIAVFVDGESRIDRLASPKRRNAVTADQKPFAIVLGCSDSRVPAEIVFDQGLGDLFVIRVAGNIVAPSQIGSVEFAAEVFGTALVVVLGHSRCGAVMATLEELSRNQRHPSRNLRSIVDRVRPAVEPLLDATRTWIRTSWCAVPYAPTCAHRPISCATAPRSSNSWWSRTGCSSSAPSTPSTPVVVDFFEGLP